MADDNSDENENHTLSTRTQSSEPPTMVHLVRALDIVNVIIIITLLYISLFNDTTDKHANIIARTDEMCAIYYYIITHTQQYDN